jgi:hypothetical protein
MTDGSVTATATLARRRACPPTLTALGDRGNREDGNEPGEQGESSHGGLQESFHDRSRSSAMERSSVASPSWTWPIPRWSSSSVQGTCNNRSTKSSVRDSKALEIDRRRRRGVCSLITPKSFPLVPNLEHRERSLQLWPDCQHRQVVFGANAD